VGSLRLPIRLVGALGIVVASFFATLWGMNYVWPACPSGRVTALTRPFAKYAATGFAYVKELPNLGIAGDSSDAPTRSTLQVCENNNLLGPLHTTHAEIVKEGHGRFSHWGSSLVFSASDNSDPNSNGRNYSVVQPR
jgi:hypothetical protein